MYEQRGRFFGMAALIVVLMGAVASEGRADGNVTVRRADGNIVVQGDKLDNIINVYIGEAGNARDAMLIEGVGTTVNGQDTPLEIELGPGALMIRMGLGDDGLTLDLQDTLTPRTYEVDMGNGGDSTDITYLADIAIKLVIDGGPGSDDTLQIPQTGIGLFTEKGVTLRGFELWLD